MGAGVSASGPCSISTNDNWLPILFSRFLMVGIADAEVLLHPLDGSVAADERRNEHLVFGGQLRQRRQREGAFNDDARVGQANAIHFEPRLADELGQFLPVMSHR